MVPEITTKEEAIEVAKQFIARGEQRVELVKKLREDDMLGLECSETVQLERLSAQDAADGWRLAKWLVLESVR
jgi:hypothetical protein